MDLFNLALHAIYDHARILTRQQHHYSDNAFALVVTCYGSLPQHRGELHCGNVTNKDGRPIPGRAKNDVLDIPDAGNQPFTTDDSLLVVVD